MEEVDFKFDFDRIIGISTEYSVYLIYSELIYDMIVESELLNKLRERQKTLVEAYKTIIYDRTGRYAKCLSIVNNELWNIQMGISEEEGRIKGDLMKKFIPEEYDIYN